MYCQENLCHAALEVLRVHFPNASSATWNKSSCKLIDKDYTDTISLHISNQPDIPLMSILKYFF